MKRLLTILAAIAIAGSASAQSSSLNTFSPYSLYGIGDPSQAGSVMLRSMGGAGIAYRSSYRTNTMNPASYSALTPSSAIFSAGVDNRNFYLAEGKKRSSFNTTNIRNMAFHIPVARSWGLVISATPYSEIGYRITTPVQSGDIGSEIGLVKYKYEGAGGIVQFKGGIGWGVTRRFSLGAEAVYYHGDVSRAFGAIFTSITAPSQDSYISLTGYTDEIVNTLLGNFGFQYSPIMNDRVILTLGGTYTMGGKMRGTIENYIPSSDLLSDTVRYSTGLSTMSLPQKFALGAYLHTTNLTIGADWEYATWGDQNASNTINGVGYRNTHAVRAGLQWIPNPGDVRNALNRWSYRIGARWENYYMTIGGKKINDAAITFGVGIPLGVARFSNLDIGFEIGQRGSLQTGMIRERYFGISVGVSFFGDDYWFVKRKYD